MTRATSNNLSLSMQGEFFSIAPMRLWLVQVQGSGVPAAAFPLHQIAGEKADSGNPDNMANAPTTSRNRIYGGQSLHQYNNIREFLKSSQCDYGIQSLNLIYSAPECDSSAGSGKNQILNLRQVLCIGHNIRGKILPGSGFITEKENTMTGNERNQVRTIMREHPIYWDKIWTEKTRITCQYERGSFAKEIFSKLRGSFANHKITCKPVVTISTFSPRYRVTFYFNQN
jgi:hypothetical protein